MEEKYGEVEEMNVCDNLGDHLVGNVYVKVGDGSIFVFLFFFYKKSEANVSVIKKDEAACAKTAVSHQKHPEA